MTAIIINLKNNYNIPVNTELETEVENMCTYTEKIITESEERVRLNTFLELIKDGTFTIEQASEKSVFSIEVLKEHLGE